MPIKTPEQLINNIIGQLNGIKKMLSNKESDCFKVVTQMKAVRAALNSLLLKYLAEQTDNCFKKDEKKAREEKIQKLVMEIIK